jgi:hypothetical protein
MRQAIQIAAVTMLLIACAGACTGGGGLFAWSQAAVPETFFHDASLLGEMKALPVYLPELAHYLLDYPRATSDGITSEWTRRGPRCSEPLLRTSRNSRVRPIEPVGLVWG